MNQIIERLTTTIEDSVYYAKGKYAPTTLCAEMENWEVRECMNRLAELEDKLEQGTVIEIPCPIGTTIYIPGTKYRHGSDDKWINTGKFKASDLEKLGKTVFLTESEAQAELERRSNV